MFLSNRTSNNLHSIVVLGTDHSSKESPRQVSVDRVMAAESLGDVMSNMRAHNARGVVRILLQLLWAGTHANYVFNLTCVWIYVYMKLHGCMYVIVNVMSVMKMGNIVPRVGIKPTSLAFWTSVLLLHHIGFPDVTTVPTPVYAAPCLRGQWRLLHKY